MIIGETRIKKIKAEKERRQLLAEQAELIFENIKGYMSIEEKNILREKEIKRLEEEEKRKRKEDRKKIEEEERMRIKQLKKEEKKRKIVEDEPDIEESTNESIVDIICMLIIT